MVRLTPEQIQEKKDYINNYIRSTNAADGSKLDANANVSTKNIATMEAELNKDIYIQINRSLIKDIINQKFGEDLANEYIRQLEAHEIYVHDESSLKNYCAAVTLYPFALKGLRGFGGESAAPKHLESFCGSFVNLMFAVSSQLAGAVAAVEFLMYFDHFAIKDYGENYLETHTKKIENQLQHVVYAINQPAAARGFQSIFFNISIFDKPYFDSMFGNFAFPDEQFTKPKYESLDKLQRFFMKWFNKEREKALLTFPVITAATLNDGNTMVDKNFQDFIAEEYSEGNSFFTFTSDNAESLSSCCRLRNDVADQINDFSYSLGAGGVSTGSMNVVTLNINRLIQDGRDLEEEIDKIHKYQQAFKTLFTNYRDAGLLPTFTEGFIDINRQYLTVGINGIVEAAEYLGYNISNNQEYKSWVSDLLKRITDVNKINSKKYGCKFNTELVPAENLGVKFAKWDKADGYIVPRDCYNSYLYKVEDNDISLLDKISMHGEDSMQYLDGGAAGHWNLESHPTKEGFKKLLDINVKEGCNYFCFNIPSTICESCGYIDKRTLTKCSKCSSTDISLATRVIGFLKPIKSFSKERQKEAGLRYYHAT